jgi:hypothetical protein
MMATIGASFLNLIDMFRQGGNEATAQIVEVLRRSSPAVRDAITVEANQGTTHQHAIRTNLPAVTWGRLYQGIPQSKSGRAMVTDTTGFVEGLSTVDERLLDISPNPAATRLEEAESFIESMTQEAETGIFYHDSASTPEKFKGLSARYNTVSGTGQNINQVVDALGSGSDNTSIWFVTWSENATHLIHPKGTQAGITRKDRGSQRVTDADGNAYYVKEEEFRWHLGVAVRDWRYNARIANIDVSNLLAGSVDVLKYMRAAYHKLHGRIKATDMKDENASINGRTVIYMNRTVYEALDAQLTNPTLNAALRLTPMQLEGDEVEAYRGIPIRVTDALLNTEARVV